MELFESVDRFTLERIFTPIAHWFEDRTGRTNFFLAWWTFGITAIGTIAQICLALANDPSDPFAYVIGFFGSIGVALATLWSTYAQREDRAIRENPSHQPRRYRCQPSRYQRILFLLFWGQTVLIFTPIDLRQYWSGNLQDLRLYMDITGCIWQFGFFSGTYLFAVRRPPYQRRKLKEKLELVPVRG